MNDMKVMIATMMLTVIYDGDSDYDYDDDDDDDGIWGRSARARARAWLAKTSNPIQSIWDQRPGA